MARAGVSQQLVGIKAAKAKVRLEMDNPRFVLRPGMLVGVEFPINLPPTINLPVDAILDSGLKQTIFVDRGNGYFEPRPVKTGWRLEDRVEIVEGLKPGERICGFRQFPPGSGDKVTSSMHLEAYPRLPMEPGTQEQNRRKLIGRSPPGTSRAMPRGPAVPKGLPGGLPLGTVLTGPHGATPAAPPAATPVQPQPQPQQTPPHLPPQKLIYRAC